MVHEDDKVITILDIHPIQPGMCLVVPKVQVDNFEDLDDENYHAVWAVVKQLALKMRQVFPDKNKVAVQVEGLEVPHAHIKVFPFNTGEEFYARPDPSAEPDHDKLAGIAERLRF